MSEKVKRGRPTKLTESILKRFIEAVRVGNYPCVVCRSLNIDPRTYKRWRARGIKSPGSIYGQFYHGVEGARADWELERVKGINTASKKDANLALKMLGCIAPDRWGPHVAEVRELKAVTEQLKRRCDELEAERAAL